VHGPVGAVGVESHGQAIVREDGAQSGQDRRHALAAFAQFAIEHIRWATNIGRKHAGIRPGRAEAIPVTVRLAEGFTGDAAAVEDALKHAPRLGAASGEDATHVAAQGHEAGGDPLAVQLNASQRSRPGWLGSGPRVCDMPSRVAFANFARNKRQAPHTDFSLEGGRRSTQGHATCPGDRRSRDGVAACQHPTRGSARF